MWPVHSGVSWTQWCVLFTVVCPLHSGVSSTHWCGLYTVVCPVHSGVACTQWCGLYTVMSCTQWCVPNVLWSPRKQDIMAPHYTLPHITPYPTLQGTQHHCLPPIKSTPQCAVQYQMWSLVPSVQCAVQYQMCSAVPSVQCAVQSQVCSVFYVGAATGAYHRIYLCSRQHYPALLLYCSVHYPALLLYCTVLYIILHFYCTSTAAYVAYTHLQSSVYSTPLHSNRV